ncbi:MAG: hypothetical protein LBR32_10590 [Propionibacteriaceae bacterium]|jgi:hypothetical protein|nr:hypothetical protein [Propionibacteriaceae bacterium]
MDLLDIHDANTASQHLRQTLADTCGPQATTLTVAWDQDQPTYLLETGGRRAALRDDHGAIRVVESVANSGQWDTVHTDTDDDPEIVVKAVESWLACGR